MDFTELELIPSNLPWPELSIDNRFQGPDGVERWFAAAIPHLVRIEQVKNQNALAQNPAATPVSNFYCTPKAEEYSAGRQALPVAVEYSCQYKIDFSGIGLVVVPPPPPPTPVIESIEPLENFVGAGFLLTGLNLTPITQVTVGLEQIVAVITAQSATEITFQVNEICSGTVTIWSEQTVPVTSVEEINVVLPPEP